MQLDQVGGRSLALQSPVQARARSPPARQMPDSAQTAASTMAQMSKRACHQPPETNGSRPAATPPRRSPRPRLIDQPLSTPKSAADPHVAPSPAARATSTCPVTLDPTAVSLPSQHSSRLCCDDQLIPPSIRRWHSANVAGKPVCGRRWDRSATPTTMRCARASSRPSNASCWNVAALRRRPRRRSSASPLSKAGTTRCDCILPSATARPWPTNRRWRSNQRKRNQPSSPALHENGATSLYLRGVSTGDFQEALAALLGKAAPNLSPAVISRLTAQWQADYDAWQKRDLSARRYVYVWADGVYLQARMEPAAECMLVLIGATPEGKKELVGFQTGVRESAQSWRELLIDIKQRGLEIAPDLAVGDGALGFWKAIEEVFPGARHQRCWVHKTANGLNKVALSVQINMKADLREIYGAPTRAAPEAAIDVFAAKYGAKYDKAVACLTKDREALLAFFDFPAEHWDHLRTSNPIESVFATVRHRTVRTKGALSAKTAKLMVFKLVNAAAKTWRRLKGENQLPKVVQGVKFQNGIEVITMPAHHAA